MGSKSHLYQVIIKNTSALKDAARSSASTINRSQSLLTTNRIPVVAASRAERVRLESLLSDVWTKSVLPYPGILGKSRGEHLVRSSASSVMRKLSVASITSNFTKRSGSFASLASFHRPSEGDSVASYTKSAPDELGKLSDRPPTSAAQDDGSTRSLLSVIRDESSPNEDETPATSKTVPQGSPTRPVKLFPTLHEENDIFRDRRYEITPPLRTTSANGGLKSSRTPPIKIGLRHSPLHGIENRLEAKDSKWSKGAGLNMSFSTEGLRSFFR